MKPLHEVYSESQEVSCTVIEGGGVESAQGFKATGVRAGFYSDTPRLDVAFVVADEPCPTAATFTQNVFCAAPVQLSKEHLGQDSYGYGRAIVINAGNANAATGEQGMQAARATAETTAKALGCVDNQVLIASTGVIGQHIDVALLEQAIPKAAAQLGDNEGGHKAAQAIMTTDTHPKEYALCYTSSAPDFEGCTFTVGGMTKGSGMIMPDMATMIAVLTTDAPLRAPDVRVALQRAVATSFNKLTVDTDTSTNDSCFLMASGKAAPSEMFIKQDTPAFEEFCTALEQVCTTLARTMARDGEGATKLITVNVWGAVTAEDADKAARSVANSPLVKTAVFGHDANWGRIAMALGKSGAVFDQQTVSIDIMGMPVCRDGLAVAFDEEKALRRFEDSEIIIDADLGAGSSSATLWTCDYSHDYITINGDYRT